MSLDELEQVYLDAADGDARDALRRALGDALLEIASTSAQVSRGFVRAGPPKPAGASGQSPADLVGRVAIRKATKAPRA